MGSEEKREVVYFFQYTRHGKRRGIEGNDTRKDTSVPERLVEYHDLGALNALDISQVLSGAVVTARTEEMLRSKTVQAYKGLGTTKPKDGKRHQM
jgi:hypothetical protein